MSHPRTVVLAIVFTVQATLKCLMVMMMMMMMKGLRRKWKGIGIQPT